MGELCNARESEDSEVKAMGAASAGSRGCFTPAWFHDRRHLPVRSEAAGRPRIARPGGWFRFTVGNCRWVAGNRIAGELPDQWILAFVSAVSVSVLLPCVFFSQLQDMKSKDGPASVARYPDLG
ncbi:hypothetical protein GQ55_8G237300 [Panicum hallii var. hallii]|uniref:Uncharacterized protein n=1 Tax=Panicum hallii var. hallii TaxID=1504633 RepID=A0A2T7CQH2_9POAL|nr:hypothetical protein GQ55_8G237300 [Panicum hallii var. hallii]